MIKELILNNGKRVTSEMFSINLDLVIKKESCDCIGIRYIIKDAIGCQGIINPLNVDEVVYGDGQAVNYA